MTLHVLREALRGCEENLAWLDEVRSYKAICQVLLGSTRCALEQYGNVDDSWTEQVWGKENDWFNVTGDLFGDRVVSIQNEDVMNSSTTTNANNTSFSSSKSSKVGWSTIPSNEKESQESNARMIRSCHIEHQLKTLQQAIAAFLRSCKPCQNPTCM